MLAVRNVGDPRQDRLQTLVKNRVPIGAALAQLGAAHDQVATAAFRTGMACAGDKLFAHPDDLLDLTAALVHRLVENLDAATSVRDDVLTAAFAAYGIMAIHPFRNGNGRTAVDFAQYLMMVRWGLSVSPISPPPDLHRIVARIYAAMDPHTTPTAAGLIAERERLLEVIADADLDHLRRHDALNCAADTFVACANGPS